MKPPESEPTAYIGAVLVLDVDLPDLALARKLHQEAATSGDSILGLLHASRQRTPATTAAERLLRLPAYHAGQGRPPAG